MSCYRLVTVAIAVTVTVTITISVAVTLFLFGTPVIVIVVFTDIFAESVTPVVHRADVVAPAFSAIVVALVRT